MLNRDAEGIITNATDKAKVPSTNNSDLIFDSISENFLLRNDSNGTEVRFAY